MPHSPSLFGEGIVRVSPLLYLLTYLLSLLLLQAYPAIVRREDGPLPEGIGAREMYLLQVRWTQLG